MHLHDERGIGADRDEGHVERSELLADIAEVLRVTVSPVWISFAALRPPRPRPHSVAMASVRLRLLQCCTGTKVIRLPSACFLPLESYSSTCVMVIVAIRAFNSLYRGGAQALDRQARPPSLRQMVEVRAK